MLSALVALAIAQQQPPIVPIARPGIDGRGRDPWVFRCVFEDRTRMVLIAPKNDFWIAFNPETCAIHKVWEGKVDFRGKVWDFSQDNSRAAGRIFYATPSEVWRLSDGAPTPGWTLSQVSFEKGAWTFPTPKSSITSPRIDASGWRKVFLAFDEAGLKGRFQVDLLDETGKNKPQSFQSALAVDGENSFQFNFKRVERPSSAMRLSIHGLGNDKRLKNLRMYGDRSAWIDQKGNQVATVWRGYELIGQTKAVWLSYDVECKPGVFVHVRHRPETTPDGWLETFEVKGLPKGTSLTLKREGLSEAVQTSGKASRESRIWVFDKDGKFDILFSVATAKGGK